MDFQLVTYCRLCLESAFPLKDIFEDAEMVNLRVIGLIKEFLHVVVSKDGRLPSAVCSSCLGKLIAFQSYKNHVIKCDNVLKYMLRNVYPGTCSTVDVDREISIKVENVECDDLDEERDIANVDCDSIEITEHKIEAVSSEPDCPWESLNGVAVQRESVLIKVENVECDDLDGEGDIANVDCDSIEITEHKIEAVSSEPDCPQESLNGVVAQRESISIKVENVECDDLDEERDIANVDCDSIEITEHKIEAVSSEPDCPWESLNGVAVQRESVPMNDDVSPPREEALNSGSEHSIEDGLCSRRQQKHIQPLNESVISKSNWREMGLRSYHHKTEEKVTNEEINTSISETLKKQASMRNPNAPAFQSRGIHKPLNLDGRREPGSKVNNTELVGGFSNGSFVEEIDSKRQDSQYKKCGIVFDYKGSISRQVKVHCGTGVSHRGVCDPQFTGGNELELHSWVQRGRKTSEGRQENRVAAEERGELKGRGQLETKRCSLSGESLDRGGDEGKGASDKQSRFSRGVSNEAHSSREDLRLHVTTQPGTRHTCHGCNKEFSAKNTLMVHVKSVHFKERNFSCNICGKNFSWNYALLNHMNSHHEQKRHICNHCQKGFTVHQSLKRHIRAIHASEKPFTCNVCQKSFGVKRTLQSHMVIHSNERPYSCDICQKAFKLKCVLQKHMAYHSNERPYSCHVCHRAFKFKYVLQNHMSMHSNERPYSCDACKKTFKLKSGLQNHMVSHSNERPYSCDVCHKAFKLKTILQNHMVLHTNERPYSCEVCHKAFKLKAGLRHHTVLHSNVGPYACDMCKKAFIRKPRLMVHIKTHTKDKNGSLIMATCAPNHSVSKVATENMKNYQNRSLTYAIYD